MTLGDDGMIYGTLSQVGVDPSTPSGLIFRMGPSGGSYEHLAQFNRFLEGHLSLRWSKAGLVNAGNGVFFGRTLFRYTTYPDMGGNLYRFSAADRSIGPVQWLPGFDGTYPPLVYARSGDLFGVSAGYSSGQQGFVFRCSEAGTFSNLGFSLNSEALSPGNPIWIVQGCPGDDNLYGLTESDYNTLLFRLTQSGEFSVLYSFYDDDSSFWPSIESGIVPGPDCALYGTAMMQERVEPYTGKLVVWKYDIGSNQVSVVATITDYESSAGVEAQLTVGWDGALYGVSYAGGAHDGGYLFRVTTAGSYTTLHNFRAEEAWEPRVALMQGPNGVLYGAAARYMADVSYNNGTVLRQEVEWGAIFSYNLSLAGYLPS
ncbi:hypothetical protein DFJ74DRAFT_682372 [Hyaloraphidium curvatum]|nr:hypothetical protein DFJ74DRAFT_682372 [Hyaloraphidium curvatum]